jgi:hypothetical protein
MAELARLILPLQKMSSEHRRIVGTFYAVNYRFEISVKAELEPLTLA